MMYVKLNRKCSLGEKGAIVEVIERIGKERVKDGYATECEAPKPKRKKTSNKAMSASE